MSDLSTNSRYLAKSVLITATLFFICTQAFSQESSTVTTTIESAPWIAGGVTESTWNASLENADTFSLNSNHLQKSMALPVAVDNSRYQSFRPVFNQRGASCAQASGIGYVYTYEINYARGLSSQIASNQYPYDFTYNFLNNGDSLMGSTTTQGWNIVKATGIPNVVEYGGFGLGKFKQWISGYTTYFSGLSNRLESYFTIPISTDSDIDNMKQWLYDHGNGSSQGGCLIFSADVEGQKIISLTPGTPDAEKKALIAFGSGGGHAMTIAGYNDEVCYDYNKDGQYTNTIDLNGDNIIDVRDRETGAVIMVNSWGPQWMDSGRVYVMYKVLADRKNQGGIYSNQLIGLKLYNQVNTIQKLICKVTLSHNSRSSIKIKCGYSTNLSSTRPSNTKSFSAAFSFAGGTYPVQGISTAPIELALDISEYLTNLSGKSTLVFVSVESTGGSGTLHSFSLIDKSGTDPVEYVCPDTDIPIIYGTTLLKITRPAVIVPQKSTAKVFFTEAQIGKSQITMHNNKIIIDNEQTEKISIHSINGKAITIEPVYSKHTEINVSQLGKGSYFIKAGSMVKQIMIN